MVFALVVALSLLAPPRRTGDAHQYLAMAGQLAHLRPPSLSPAEEAEFGAWLEAQAIDSGFPDGARAIRQPALVHEGRQEFSHFWVFPLIVAPATGLSTLLGLHSILAFTITNALLLAAALHACARAFGPLATLLLLASPLVWFVGRAQVEVFTVALLALAMAAAARGQWAWAGVAAAMASTQNLPIAATIPLFWAGGLPASSREWTRLWNPGNQHRLATPNPHPQPPPSGYPVLCTGRGECGEGQRGTQRTLLLGAVAVGIALLHPAYYVAQLGVVTPQQLNGGIAGAAPDWTRLLAPLVDPDIGFLPWLPVTAALSVAGYVFLLRARLRGTPLDRNLAAAALVAVPIALWFLAVFAQTTNVNSGGTVHISRYALWLLPLTLPALSIAMCRLAPRALPAALLVVAALCVAYLVTFRPDQPERYVTHSPQAAWLIAHTSDLYHPLPEIFVERTLHIDGGPRASAADANCRIILLVAPLDRPCPLTDSERASAGEIFDNGAAAVWVRRTGDGASSVSTAAVSP
ncbi:MAG: hypothetical protein IT338_05070 [Thermomicrobiales bacterium]|nr:hypothetical protein [Thermomicrobiales bacterium]